MVDSALGQAAFLDAWAGRQEDGAYRSAADAVNGTQGITVVTDEFFRAVENDIPSMRAAHAKNNRVCLLYTSFLYQRFIRTFRHLDAAGRQAKGLPSAHIL